MRKSYRVKDERAFQKVFLQGESCANRNFVCYTLKEESNRHFRVGISAGKKLGNAVKRNAVKRKIRQAIFELKPYIQRDVDFLIIARPNVANLEMSEVKKNIQHVLKVAKIYHEGEQEESE